MKDIVDTAEQFVRDWKPPIDWTERQRLLYDAIQGGPDEVKGKSILLVDDLIESGSTLRRTADVMLETGGAKAVYALVITRTK
jgi:predicted amidophosphoribosyltransferase